MASAKRPAVGDPEQTAEDGVRTLPVIRTLRVGREPVEVCCARGGDGNLWWHSRPARRLAIRTNIAGFHFAEGNEWPLTQVILNIFMFNKLQLKGHAALRIRTLREGYVFHYYMDRGEVVTIPTLPRVQGVYVSFVLTDDLRPALQVISSRPPTEDGKRQ